MVEEILTYSVDTKKEYLSSTCQIYKSDSFIKATRSFVGVDDFLKAITQGIIIRINDKLSFFDDTAFCAVTDDNIFGCYFKFGKYLDNFDLAKRDIVFFAFYDREEQNVKRDSRFEGYLLKEKFNVKILKNKSFSHEKIEKIYRLAMKNDVYFPLLNKTQKELVETEDYNVIAQGVAGSGKTNICIDKIIYSACREYAGKTLYTTFSRGLLIDTEKKADTFKDSLTKFIKDYKIGRIEFCDKNIQQAIENRLGIYLQENDIDKILQKLEVIINYLENKVDYLLIEDLYKNYFGEAKIADEAVFRLYLNSVKNYQLLNRLEKIKNISEEVIYKEIYGLIFGSFDIKQPKYSLSAQEYKDKRKDSFSSYECDTIYYIAQDYYKFLKQNGYKDNNIMSRELMAADLKKYSLVIVDETQDMTEVNLCLMKKLSIKMFCVGDAMQMINPSYFSIAYLKRLMFDKDIVNVKELTNNYRNTEKIAEILDKLTEINKSLFGTHSFVLKNEKVNSADNSRLILTSAASLNEKLSNVRLDDCSIIVLTEKEKQELKKTAPDMEILTVSDIKGLERNNVLLYNILSSNFKKWQNIDRILINRKQADENSIYRYYFNLFYVALSRAKANIFVAESKEISLFKDFFDSYFEKLNTAEAYKLLYELAYRDIVDEDEIIEKINAFIRLNQYENAKYAVSGLIDENKKQSQLIKIDVNEKFVRYGKYREAGIKLWEAGLNDEAREQFVLSKDDALVRLLDACKAKKASALDIGIAEFLPEVYSQELPKNLIFDVIKDDLKELREKQKSIYRELNALKEK